MSPKYAFSTGNNIKLFTGLGLWLYTHGIIIPLDKSRIP
jgi:hypothetical protein